MSIENLKYKLDHQAYDKLVEVVKRNTQLSKLDETNIKVIKEALSILTSWLEEVYQLDQKLVDMDEEGTDISKLFKDS
jgi:DNA-binding transcriptional regulator GbsR (MarR family)